MINFSSSWTLFLDRDGVINQKTPGYIQQIDEFRFCEGTLIALETMAALFDKIVIVTNQQGIGKELMSLEMLENLHEQMLHSVIEAGGRIDAIYYCPHLATLGCACRKPEIGMAEQARNDFPEIEFTKSIMVGDSKSDLEMGRSLGMYCVWINADHRSTEKMPEELFDLKCKTLAALSEILVNHQQ